MTENTYLTARKNEKAIAPPPPPDERLTDVRRMTIIIQRALAGTELTSLSQMCRRMRAHLDALIAEAGKKV